MYVAGELKIDKMRTLIKLFVILLLAIIAYNYFLGDDVEREESAQVIENVKELGASVVNLLVAEKERISAGKYSEIMEEIGESIGLIKAHSEDLNISEEELENLDNQKKELDSLVQRELHSPSGDSDSDDGVISEKIQNLLQQLERITSREYKVIHLSK